MKTISKPKFTSSNQKTYVLTKLQPHTNEDIENQVKNLFIDPNTYLQFPIESKINFVVGKKIRT